MVAVGLHLGRLSIVHCISPDLLGEEAIRKQFEFSSRKAD